MIRKILFLFIVLYSLVVTFGVTASPNRDFFLKSTKNVPRIGRAKPNDKPPSDTPRGPFFAKPKQIPRIGRTAMDDIDDNVYLNCLKANGFMSEVMKRSSDNVALPTLDMWNSYQDLILSQAKILDLLQTLENEHELMSENGALNNDIGGSDENIGNYGSSGGREKRGGF